MADDLIRFYVTDGPTSMMTRCQCGDVFSAHGSADEVNRAHAEWEARHCDCIERPRDERKVFWLSFCDVDKPTGEQFLGACLVEVTAEEVHASYIEVFLRFPFAQPNAEWIAAAIRKTHRLGCNPGGKVAAREIPPDHPNLQRYQLGVLMDRATCERLDRECDAGN